MPCAATCETTRFHASKISTNVVCIASPHTLPYPDHRAGLRTGRYHEIVYAGVASPHHMNTAQSGIFVGRHWNVGNSGSYGSQRREAPPASRRWQAESPGTENPHISSSRPKMAPSARYWRHHRLARSNHSAADGLHSRCYTGVDSILAGKPDKEYEA